MYDIVYTTKGRSEVLRKVINMLYDYELYGMDMSSQYGERVTSYEVATLLGENNYPRKDIPNCIGVMKDMLVSDVYEIYFPNEYKAIRIVRVH